MPDDSQITTKQCEHQYIRWSSDHKGFTCRGCGAVFKTEGPEQVKLGSPPDKAVPAPSAVPGSLQNKGTLLRVLDGLWVFATFASATHVWDGSQPVPIDSTFPELELTDWKSAAPPVVRDTVKEQPPSACAFLKKAHDTLESRGREYNKSGQERSMKAIVEAFNAVTGHKLSITEGWKFMVLLKLVRLSASPGHTDSAVDLVGYAALTAEQSQQPKL